MLDDRLAAGDPLLRVLNRFLERRAAKPERHRGDRDVGAHVGAALGRRRQDAAFWHLHVVEEDLRHCHQRAGRSLTIGRRTRPGRIALDEKGPRAVVGLRNDDEQLRRDSQRSGSS